MASIDQQYNRRIHVRTHPSRPEGVTSQGVSEQTGLSRSGVYDRLNPESKYYDPSFPKQFKLGFRSVGWDAAEIERWIAERKENGMVGTGH